MGVSQGNFSAAPAGLNLVAWAFLKGSDGSIIKSSGIASSTRSGLGTYDLTLTVPRANTNYLVIVQQTNTGGPVLQAGYATSVSAFTAKTYFAPNTSSNAEVLSVAVYE